MTHIADLFDLAMFDDMRENGYIRIQTHPTLPLSIANYAEKAQFEHVWNPVTLQCRGLIYDQDGTILARPYRKFFNYGDDQNTGPLDMDAPVIVSDKLDGSLGISYPTPDGWAVATRGSFASDQAIHATEVLRTRYPDFKPVDGFTYLWEIVYPDNRIVIDYEGQDDLILHGVVDIETGAVTIDYRWDGPVADQFPYLTLAEAVAAEPRPNREGLVVMYADTGLMVKLKQEDYVALHRIITGLNAKTIWEWLGDGKTVGDLCATIPDEFHAWVEGVSHELTTAANDLIKDSAKVFEQIDPLLHRREFADEAKKHGRLTPYLFMMLDGQTERVQTHAWREVKPSGARSMVNHSEAVA